MDSLECGDAQDRWHQAAEWGLSRLGGRDERKAYRVSKPNLPAPIGLSSTQASLFSQTLFFMVNSLWPLLTCVSCSACLKKWL